MSQNKKINLVVKNPQEYPRTWINVNPTLEKLQSFVNGHIESFYIDELPDGCVCFCNENGKMLNMIPNIALKDSNGNIIDVVAGPIIVVKYDEDGELVELTDYETKDIVQILNHKHICCVMEDEPKDSPVKYIVHPLS